MDERSGKSVSLGRVALLAGLAAMVAFIVGVWSVGPVFTAFTGLVLPLGLVAVALGVWGITQDRSHRRAAIGGVVLGVLVLLLFWTG